MNRMVVTIVAVAAFVLFLNAYAGALVLKSISSGEYEDGMFTERDDMYEAEALVNEADGNVVITDVINSTREGRPEDGIEYDITNVMESKGLSAITVSKDKKGQKIITAVRESDLGSSETLILGEDFYEFSKAVNGRFYLEYGSVSGGRK
ncbi:MAG: hypothetical protein PHH49_08135 [Candidatus Omnitrophica bacterium]|nr:hypothetical protein [Candidatus Omnitrophota bacterium]